MREAASRSKRASPPSCTTSMTPAAVSHLSERAAARTAFATLVAHDLKLWRRELSRGLSRAAPIGGAVAVAAAVVILHALVWPISSASLALAESPANRVALDHQFAFAGIVLASIVAASALRRTIDLIFEHRDLDLLLASPVLPAAVFASRGLALATRSGAVAALLWIPFADLAALRGKPAWLAVDLAMIGVSLAATAIGMALALALFACFGPRRVRPAAVVLQTLLGSAYFLAIAAMELLPPRLVDALTDPNRAAAFDHDGPLFAPVRAAEGDAAAIAQSLVVASAIFAIACACLGRRLLGASAAAGSRAAARSGQAPRTRFAASAGEALLAKERRLMARNPGLLSLGAMFVVMFAPAALQSAREGWRGAAPLIVSVTILFAGQLASALAALTVGGEEVPDLLLSAPLGRGWILRRKVQAFLPALAAAILLPSLALALASPWCGCCAAAFAFAAAGNVALLTHWTAATGDPPSPGRRVQMSPLAAILTQIVCASWTVAGALAAMKIPFAPIPLALAALALTAARPRTMTLSRSPTPAATRRRTPRPWRRRAGSAAAPP